MTAELPVAHTRTGLAAHDGYAPHSHEVRPDHRGVRREAQHADRWAALRDKLTEDIAIEQELGDDYSESAGQSSEATAGWHWGKAQALRDLLAWMDREDGQ